MKILFLNLIIITTILSGINAVNATPQISIDKISTTIPMTLSKSPLADDYFLTEGTYGSEVDHWFTDSIWWASPSHTITFDLGDTFLVQEITLQVDYDDDYQLDYSIDNVDWKNLFRITSEDDDLITWGFDTMSSDELNVAYVENIDFTAVEAQYIRVSASNGDYDYSISELQVFGNNLSIGSPLTESQVVTSPVPAPPSVMLFGAGLMMLIGLQYRRKKQMNDASNS